MESRTKHSSETFTDTHQFDCGSSVMHEGKDGKEREQRAESSKQNMMDSIHYIFCRGEWNDEVLVPIWCVLFANQSAVNFPMNARVLRSTCGGLGEKNETAIIT